MWPRSTFSGARTSSTCSDSPRSSRSASSWGGIWGSEASGMWLVSSCPVENATAPVAGHLDVQQVSARGGIPATRDRVVQPRGEVSAKHRRPGQLDAGGIESGLDRDFAADRKKCEQDRWSRRRPENANRATDARYRQRRQIVTATHGVRARVPALDTERRLPGAVRRARGRGGTTARGRPRPQLLRDAELNGVDIDR